MDAGRSWVIAWFSAERAVGMIRSATGEEATFGIEVFRPCDAATARSLAESDRRRHLLLPRAGEAVDVTWRTSRRGEQVLAEVARTEPLDAPPAMRFLDWLARVGEHVSGVADWGPREWELVFRDDEGGLEDTVCSPYPETPDKHLAVLDWIRRHGPGVVALRLEWLRDEPTPVAARDGASAPEPRLRAVEAWDNDEPLFLDLPHEVVERLLDQKLMLPAGDLRARAKSMDPTGSG